MTDQPSPDSESGAPDRERLYERACEMVRKAMWEDGFPDAFVTFVRGAREDEGRFGLAIRNGESEAFQRSFCRAQLLVQSSLPGLEPMERCADCFVADVDVRGDCGHLAASDLESSRV